MVQNGKNNQDMEKDRENQNKNSQQGQNSQQNQLDQQGLAEGNNKSVKEILFLEPVFKEVVWGGEDMRTEFGYSLPSDHVGECWGISAHPHGDCQVREGYYKGKKLSELWAEQPELFGNLPASGFPLLIKIIDAKQDLSVQVHPNDAYAKVNENGSLGKTECWYVINCEQGASLVIGHNAENKEQMKEMIEKNEWQEFLRKIPVHKGDFIQIDPGTIHAIRGGILILETQQSSDITYRLYDYGRLVDGKPRELHLEKAIDVITVPAKDLANSVKSTADLPVNRRNVLESNVYYTVWKIDVEQEFSFEQGKGQEHGYKQEQQEQSYPFLNMSVIEGNGLINGQKIQKGDHFIIPSGFGTVELKGKMQLIASAVGQS